MNLRKKVFRWLETISDPLYSMFVLAGALADSELWDGRVQNVQVADATEKSMEVRVMVSAKDSPTLWDLRVEIREKLISFLQKEHPDLLPTARVRLGESEDNGAGRDTNDPG